MDLKPKKLYSPGSNLLFDIITTPLQAFFVLSDEFLDAYGIPHQVLLFDDLLLQGSSIVLVPHCLNLCTHQFTVDFVITFSAPYIIYVLT